MSTLQLQALALGDPTRHEVFRFIADVARPVEVVELTEPQGWSSRWRSTGSRPSNDAAIRPTSRWSRADPRRRRWSIDTVCGFRAEGLAGCEYLGTYVGDGHGLERPSSVIADDFDDDQEASLSVGFDAQVSRRPHDFERLGDRLLDALASVDGAGRAFFAALRDLPVPGSANGRAWHGHPTCRTQLAGWGSRHSGQSGSAKICP